jgi:hypothetical protein
MKNSKDDGSGKNPDGQEAEKDVLAKTRTDKRRRRMSWQRTRTDKRRRMTFSI